jgi:hypothetical protein
MNISLQKRLEEMDIPQSRKDVTKPENIKWLLRNLPIRNSHKIGFSEIIEELKKI